MARANRSPWNLWPFGKRNGRPSVVAEYDISFDPIDIGDPVLPPEMDDEYDRMWELMQRNPTAAIPTLQDWVYRYPAVPSVKNWLAMCYRALSRDAEADVMGARMLAEHPDYLFARLYRAERLLDKGRVDEVPEALGGLGLKEIYPQRNLFHVTEALNLWAVLAKYYLLAGDPAHAVRILDSMRDLQPDHPRTKQIEAYVCIAAGYLPRVDGDPDVPSDVGGPPVRGFRQGSHTPKKERNRKGKRRR